MSWPLVLSVPHAGLEVPPEVEGLNLLTLEQIADDGDGGAAAVYLPLEGRAVKLVTTPVARAFVDMNRAQDDLRKDGVVKTHTCWDVPIYRRPLERAEIEALLARYHAPYHGALAAPEPAAKLGLDLHTMAAHGPPVGPDPGVERPWLCVGDARGDACPPEWAEALVAALDAVLGEPRATRNLPFSGGYITRSRPGGLPWLQIEMSRAPWASDEDKRRVLSEAIDRWLAEIGM